MSRWRRNGCVLLGAVVLVGCTSDDAARSFSSAEPRQPSSSSVVGPAGGALFDAPMPWTTDVSGLSPSDRSAAIIQTLTDLGGWGNDNVLQADFSIPIFYADADTPRRQVIGGDDYCFGGGAPDCDTVPTSIPLPDGANIEGSADLTCDITGATDGQSDCHLLVVDKGQNTLYEIYQASSDGENITAVGGLYVWDLAKAYPDTLRGDQCTSADAAGFPIAAMTPTADQVATGELNHALRFILPNDRMKAGVFVRPATHAGGPESTEPDAPPYGVRFRLKPDFDESGYSDGAKVVLKALKTHGMLLSDGGDIALTFADDRTSTAKWADLGIDPQTFAGIAVDQFDVVDLGPEIEATYDCVRNP